MRDWQLAYLGRRTFPANITDFELRQAFTFGSEEQSEIRHAFRSRLRIGVALQLGFLRLTGTTLRTLEYVPAIVLRHLAAQFAVQGPELATLRAIYRRAMTRIAHQGWVIDHEGFRELDAAGETGRLYSRAYACHDGPAATGAECTGMVVSAPVSDSQAASRSAVGSRCHC
jgi:hypothetical protein